MYIYIPTKWGSIHLSYELLGMLVGSVGKAFAIVLGRPGFESPHHHFQQETTFIFFDLCSQRACFSVTARPCRCRGDQRRRWTTGMTWYDIIYDITSNIITYVYMISYMISWYDIMLHIIVYGIWYRVGSVWYHIHKSYDIKCTLPAYDIIDFFMISYAIS